MRCCNASSNLKSSTKQDLRHRGYVSSRPDSDDLAAPCGPWPNPDDGSAKLKPALRRILMLKIPIGRPIRRVGSARIMITIDEAGERSDLG